MTSDPALGLRVSRLENDTEALYDLITEVRSTQDGHTRRFDALDTRLDSVNTRFDHVETRLGGLETTLVEVLRRLPEPG